jgi:hypothetical protein
MAGMRGMRCGGIRPGSGGGSHGFDELRAVTLRALPGAARET